MGHHINPQYYLKGFSDPKSGLIWRYEIGSEKPPQSLPIKNVAQVKNYYDNETEAFLANEIERPANFVLKKINNKHPISLEEKIVLGKYIFTFFKRVPKSYQRLKNSTPDILTSIRSEIEAYLTDIKKNNPTKTSLIDKRQRELTAFCDKHIEDPPKEAWLNALRMPSQLPEYIARNLVWTFVNCSDPFCFLTSDNPVSRNGRLDHSSGDLLFPISSSTVLLANRCQRDSEYIDTNKQMIIKINRRIISCAKQYIYSPKKESWISKYIGQRQF